MKVFTLLSVFFTPIFIFANPHLDDTPLWQLATAYKQDNKAYMDDIQRVFQNLSPEEVLSYIDRTTKQGKTLLQIFIENNLSETDLFWLLSQIGSKLEQLGWSSKEVIETFYSDNLFKDRLIKDYPQVFQALEKIKTPYSKERQLIIYDSKNFTYFWDTSMGGIFGAFVGLFSGYPLGMEEGLSYYISAMALLGAAISPYLTHRQIKRNKACQTTFSELNIKGSASSI